ncbi:MAG: hypothetical protein NTZ16_11080 [Verrucomicrobia bacterium]|nr:hypothetical protein [Verrucomicrobiota bacterium]
MESQYLPTPNPTPEDDNLNQLLNSKSGVLRTKLETLAAEIQTRFAIWNHNLDRLNQDQSNIQNQLQHSTRLARYHLRDPKDVSQWQNSGLKLGEQQRNEDVLCWRDVVMVMRDFLETWEVHEQAKNRSIFLNHAGSRSEDDL